VNSWIFDMVERMICTAFTGKKAQKRNNNKPRVRQKNKNTHSSHILQTQNSHNKKLSYRRETARQLPTPPAPSGYTYAYGRILNPQQTYVKRAVH